MIFSNISDTLKTLFIIVVPIIVVLLLAILLYKPIKKAVYKKKFQELYGKKIYKIALYGDYYLINLFHFDYDDRNLAVVDHVLFTDKYIYVIMDNYYEGSIAGKINDKSLVLISPKGKKQYINNPVNDTKLIIKRIAMMTAIDPAMFIGISLINKECPLDVEQTANDYYIIQVDKFARLVEAIESRKVAPLNDEELKKLVQDLYRISQKGKKKNADN